MNLVDTLRKNALEAMKAKDSVATTILRLAQSEVQALEARQGRTLTDDEAFGALRKLVKSNEETLAATSGETAEGAILQRELEILRGLLPKALSFDAVMTALGSVSDPIKAAANEGQATGVAMKYLKSLGSQVVGTDVARAVKQIRG